MANVNIQSQVQLQLNESVSIYVSGLPTDIDEKDLGECASQNISPFPHFIILIPVIKHFKFAIAAH